MPKRIPWRRAIAASLLTFCAACQADPGRQLAAAGIRRAEAAAPSRPAWPEACAPTRPPAIAEGERLDIVVLRLAAERAALNRRLGDCGDWYRMLRERIEAPS